MKVLLYVPYYDGISHMRDYVIKYVNGLSYSDIQVILLVNHAAVTDFSVKNLDVVSLDKPYFSYDEAKNKNLLLWLIYRVYFNCLLFFKLVRILRTQKPDIVHFLSYELVSLSVLLSFTRHSKFLKNICFIEIAAANFKDDNLSQNIFVRIWRKIMAKSLRIIDREVMPYYAFNSKTHMKLFVNQVFGFREFDERRLIFLGDSRKVKPSKVRRELSEVPTFLFFGTIRDDKGFDILCEAINRLSELHLKYNFIIAGKPLGFDATKVIEKFGIQFLNNVSLNLNFLNDQEIDDYFKRANYLVLPYNLRYKGSSGPVYEAASRGIPLVSTDVSEMGVLVKDFDLGYVIEPNNVDALFNMLKDLIFSKDTEAYDLKVSQVERFAKEFSEENYLNRLVDSYKIAVRFNLAPLKK